MIKTKEILKGQIVFANRGKYIIDYENERISAEVSGRFNFMAYEKSDYPVVGDFVHFHYEGEDFGIIERIETRTGIISRTGVTTQAEEQILAANVDIAFICMSLNKDFNIKKLRNFVTLTYGSGIESIILLTKKDLAEDIDFYLGQIDESFANEIIVISSYETEDIDKIRNRIAGKTVVFIGSSGVGKSTIINKLLQEEKIKTSDIRASDAQGRHTTSSRELIKLSNNSKVIDTPGIRIITSYMIDESEFKDIKQLEKECRFRDCTHTDEPGCKVKESLENGELSEERFEQYRKACRYNRFNEKRERERKILRERKMRKY